MSVHHHIRLVFILLIFLARPVVLHAQVAPIEEENPILPIFTDGKKEGIWGVAKSECSAFKLVKDVKHSGRVSLYMEWDVTGGACETAKMGFRFPTVNILPYLKDRALTFYVRSELMEMHTLPITFVLQDGFRDETKATFNAVGLMGEKISTEWVKAYVPLRNFDFVKSGGDPTDIIQLSFEFDSYAQIYIDDMVIEPFTDPLSEPKPIKPVSEAVHDLLQMPRVLFADELPNGWGIGTPYCNNFKLTQDEKYRGNTSIAIDMAPFPGVCDWSEFGLSWTGWELVDLSKLAGMSALQFRIKSELAHYEFDIKVGFEDYDGDRSMLWLATMYLEENKVSNEWQIARIPLPAFSFKSYDVNPAEIKQIVFTIGKDVKCYIDEIELVEFTGSRDNPFRR